MSRVSINSKKVELASKLFRFFWRRSIDFFTVWEVFMLGRIGVVEFRSSNNVNLVFEGFKSIEPGLELFIIVAVIRNY